ncbi:hypothetical protein SGCOL_006992 [Colletotrichum sp. CLE4]
MSSSLKRGPPVPPLTSRSHSALREARTDLVEDVTYVVEENMPHDSVQSRSLTASSRKRSAERVSEKSAKRPYGVSLALKPPNNKFDANMADNDGTAGCERTVSEVNGEGFTSSCGEQETQAPLEEATAAGFYLSGRDHYEASATGGVPAVASDGETPGCDEGLAEAEDENFKKAFKNGNSIAASHHEAVQHHTGA